MILYFGLSIFGFAMGHLIGLWRGWTFLPLGSLNFGLSTLGSVIVLLLVIGSAAWKPANKARYNLRLFVECCTRAQSGYAIETLKT